MSPQTHICAPDVTYGWQFPDIVERGHQDRWVSVREPFRGEFVWSWCAYGFRLWREGTTSGRS